MEKLSKQLMLILTIILTFNLISDVYATDITVTTTGYTIEGQDFVESDTPLADAISASQNNDIIYLEQGKYKESITIDKTLSIVGKTGNDIENVKNIVLGGDSSTLLSDIITVSSKDTSISNITVANATNAGILISEGLYGFKIDNVYIYNISKYGILVDASVHINNSIIEENGFGISTGSGICLYHGANSTVQNTKLINNNRNQIYANNVENLTIINNEIIINNENKEINSKRNGIVLLESTKAFISQNSVNSIGHQGNGVDNTNSVNNMIYKNNVTGFGWNGIALDDSTTIAVINNKVYDNIAGIQLDSENCSIKYNHVYDNDNAGLVIKNADINNNISKNWVDTNNTVLVGNMDVTTQAVNVSHNYWGTTNFGVISSKMADVYGKIYFVPYYIDEEFNELTNSPIVNINKNKSYSKIQYAIDDADEFDIINVKDGIYEEQILINKNITLNGSENAVLKLPESPNQIGIEEETKKYVYNVLMYGGTVTDNKVTGDKVINANINGFKFDANNYVPEKGVRYSIIFVRNANSNINNLNITNISVSTAETFGISVNGNSNTNITNNTIYEFSRGGISVKMGYTNITGNIINGPNKDRNVTWAPNALQLADLAEGIVSKNIITGCGWTGERWTGTAMLLYGADNVTVSENQILNSQVGIYVCGCPGKDVWEDPLNYTSISLLDNTLRNNTYSIILANYISGCNVSGNKLYNSELEAFDVSYTSWYEGPEARNISIHENEIYGSKGYNAYVFSDIKDVNMSHNYWDSNDYLDIKSKMYGNIVFNPYYSDSRMKKLIRITDEINYQFVQLSDRLTKEGIINNVNLVNEENYESFTGLELEKEDITKIKFTGTLNLSSNELQYQLINLKDTLDIKTYGVYLSEKYDELCDNPVSYEFKNINNSDVLKNLSESKLYGKLILINVSDGELIENKDEYITEYKLINNTFIVNSTEFVTCYLDIKKPTISRAKISPNGLEKGTYNITASAIVKDNTKLKEVYVLLRGQEFNLTSSNNISYNKTFEYNASITGTHIILMIAKDIAGNNATKPIYITVLNSTVKEALGNETSNITIDDEIWGEIEEGGIKQLNNTNISLTEIKVKNDTLILPKLKNVSAKLTVEAIEKMEEIENTSNNISVSNATTEEEIENVVNTVINKTKVISSSGFNISNMTLSTKKEDNKVTSEIKFTAENTTKKGYTIMRLPLGNLKLTRILVNDGTKDTPLKENDYNSTLGWYRLIDNKVVELTLIKDPEVSLLFESLLPSEPDTPDTPTYSGRSSKRHNTEISTILTDTGQTVSKVVGAMLSKSRIIIGADADIDAAKMLSLTYENRKEESYGTVDMSINSNTLLIGGPVANPLANKYDRYFDIQITNDVPGKDTGVIQVQKINGYQVIYVAGSDRVGTKTAVQYYLSMTENVTGPLKIKLKDGKPTLIN
ncbi:hypothetical protein J2127_000603 [Methanococcus voltae]|uniref:right-handed parallel beta-helix repeat-containing protein n=1 Tax=Methanococcus voltae TaxID=2188 RepID=UPI001AE89DA1|nr:right-handed parallel beta-helix repeat-containing protein [Methanococcus voltae]MBP2143448.1 hypothetical protein [Methanococcus voltae]